ncbi:transcription elongation factor Spt5 [Babesia caballi]|uniref:Transcription elongation factor Spt5 n=1 Tax=Babesia caballi TaxID=5871 RepID=A0AAV4LTD1_BABCB|nr:transcription elongation factor Spt5 [Babesia caballi]
MLRWSAVEQLQGRLGLLGNRSVGRTVPGQGAGASSHVRRLLNALPVVSQRLTVLLSLVDDAHQLLSRLDGLHSPPRGLVQQRVAVHRNGLVQVVANHLVLQLQLELLLALLGQENLLVAATPEANGAVVGGADEKVSVAAHSQGAHGSAVPTQLADELVGVAVPELDEGVQTRGDEGEERLESVGVEGLDGAVVQGNGQDAPVAGVPHVGGVVGQRGGGELLQTEHLARALLLQKVLEDLDATVAEGGGEGRAVGVLTHTDDVELGRALGGVRRQLVHLVDLAGVQVEHAQLARAGSHHHMVVARDEVGAGHRLALDGADAVASVRVPDLQGVGRKRQHHAVVGRDAEADDGAGMPDGVQKVDALAQGHHALQVGVVLHRLGGEQALQLHAPNAYSVVRVADCEPAREGLEGGYALEGVHGEHVVHLVRSSVVLGPAGRPVGELGRGVSGVEPAQQLLKMRYFRLQRVELPGDGAAGGLHSLAELAAAGALLLHDALLPALSTLRRLFGVVQAVEDDEGVGHAEKQPFVRDLQHLRGPRRRRRPTAARNAPFTGTGVHDAQAVASALRCEVPDPHDAVLRNADQKAQNVVALLQRSPLGAEFARLELRLRPCAVADEAQVGHLVAVPLQAEQAQVAGGVPYDHAAVLGAGGEQLARVAQRQAGDPALVAVHVKVLVDDGDCLPGQGLGALEAADRAVRVAHVQPSFGAVGADEAGHVCGRVEVAGLALEVHPGLAGAAVPDAHAFVVARDDIVLR